MSRKTSRLSRIVLRRLTAALGVRFHDAAAAQLLGPFHRCHARAAPFTDGHRGVRIIRLQGRHMALENPLVAGRFDEVGGFDLDRDVDPQFQSHVCVPKRQTASAGAAPASSNPRLEPTIYYETEFFYYCCFISGISGVTESKTR